MKKTILAIAAIMSFLSAQADRGNTMKITPVDGPCGKYVNRMEDEMDGKVIYAVKDYIKTGKSTEDRITIIVTTAGHDVIVALYGEGDGFNCVDKGSKILFLFQDGSRVEMESQCKFNCDGNANLYFGGVSGQYSELEQFKTKKLKSVRMYDHGHDSVQTVLTEEQAVTLLETVKCIADKAGL